MADQFEIVVKKHGETFIWDILENWERHHSIRHPRPMTLEERWDHFIRATDTSALIAA
jgi:hypothetical protein